MSHEREIAWRDRVIASLRVAAIDGLTIFAANPLPLSAAEAQIDLQIEGARRRWCPYCNDTGFLIGVTDFMANKQGLVACDHTAAMKEKIK